MSDTYEMTLNSPMTREDWAKLTDANMEHTQSVTFQTEGGKKVEFVKVKHGRWIVDTKFGNDVLSGGKMVTCSCCGKGGRFDGGSPYCSNCGAKMDGERRDSENG